MKAKKISISLLSIALFLMGTSPLSAQKTITTSKFNPSTQGTYDIRSETHDNANDHHWLTCQNPGDKACLWEMSPWSKMTVYDGAENDVRESIMSGVFTGTSPIEDGSVTWYSTSINDYTFILNVATP